MRRALIHCNLFPTLSHTCAYGPLSPMLRVATVRDQHNQYVYYETEELLHCLLLVVNSRPTLTRGWRATCAMTRHKVVPNYKHMLYANIHYRTSYVTRR